MAVNLCLIWILTTVSAEGALKVERGALNEWNEQASVLLDYR